MRNVKVVFAVFVGLGLLLLISGLVLVALKHVTTGKVIIGLGLSALGVANVFGGAIYAASAFD